MIQAADAGIGIVGKVYVVRECSGSVVECLTRDRGAEVLSLTGVTALRP